MQCKNLVHFIETQHTPCGLPRKCLHHTPPCIVIFVQGPSVDAVTTPLHCDGHQPPLATNELLEPIAAVASPQAEGQSIVSWLPLVLIKISACPPYQIPLTLQSPGGSGPIGAIGGGPGGGGGGGGGCARVDETHQKCPGPCLMTTLPSFSWRTPRTPGGTASCFGHTSRLRFGFDGCASQMYKLLRPIRAGMRVSAVAV